MLYEVITFLAMNITIGLLILIIALYTSRALDFAVFPSVLLITTLFRLSLNVASTRLILLHVITSYSIHYTKLYDSGLMKPCCSNRGKAGWDRKPIRFCAKSLNWCGRYP